MAKTIAELQEKITLLESQLVRVENMANDNEQYSRRYNVRISGFEEERSEDCIEKVVQFRSDKLKVVLSNENIDRAHIELESQRKIDLARLFIYLFIYLLTSAVDTINI